MVTLFDSKTAAGIMDRIAGLDPAAQRQWGKMTIAQMLQHCADGMQMAKGTRPMHRIFIGRIIGPMVKKKVLNDEPMERNLPTTREMIMTGSPDFEAEKRRLLKEVQEFVQAGKSGPMAEKHPFFGRMTAEEWGISTGKHLDHHLRQFNS